MKAVKLNNQGKIILSSLIVIIAIVLLVGVIFGGKGNAAPKGKHYTLNILGKSWGEGKSSIENCGEGHRIFVNLGEVPTNKQGKLKGKSSMDSVTEIYLFESVDDSFQVLDCDGTDGVAAFMLPDPNEPGTRCTRYSVWVRALGNPGGKADMKTCATYEDESGLMWTGCSTEIVGFERKKGKGHKQTFEDVSKQLLTICVPVCVDYNEVTESCDKVEWQRKYIFDDSLEDEYWKYDNNGLRHAQIRFYWERSCPDVTGDNWDCAELGNPYEE